MAVSLPNITIVSYIKLLTPTAVVGGQARTTIHSRVDFTHDTYKMETFIPGIVL